MIEDLEVRERRPDDDAAFEVLYPDAFPDEDLLPLVRALHRERSGVVSLVGIVDTVLVGHVAFTECQVVGAADTVSMLAPLAVASARQGQGVGTALVRAGLQLLENTGVGQVFVLGDPAYYGRFGFQADDRVAPPYPLPEEWHGAWQSLSLSEGREPPRGQLAVPELWRRPELWAA